GGGHQPGGGHGLPPGLARPAGRAARPHPERGGAAHPQRAAGAAQAGQALRVQAGQPPGGPRAAAG
ncbi:unnamed protein product, partial [Heterosigma akashiwo]